MQAKDLQDIIGVKIPNALHAVHDLEASVTPHLVKLQQNRDKIPSDLATQLDKAMADIKEAKEKLQQHGG